MEFTIIQDTREQTPLTFRASESLKGVEKGTLKVGDYSIKGYEHNIAVERKSLADLYGTLLKGNERFQKELERSIGYDAFYIVVEGSFSDFRDKNWKGSQFIQPGENYALKTLYTLQFKYPWIHIVFLNDRNEASSFIRNLFKQYVAWKDKHDKQVHDGPEWILKMVGHFKRRVH